MSATTYPNAPGFKVAGTSKDAARSMKKRADRLKQAILKALASKNMTPDETAKTIRQTPFSVRPRFSELAEKGLIEKTGSKRLNASGKPANVWRAK